MEWTTRELVMRTEHTMVFDCITFFIIDTDHTKYGEVRIDNVMLLAFTDTSMSLDDMKLALVQKFTKYIKKGLQREIIF